MADTDRQAVADEVTSTTGQPLLRKWSSKAASYHAGVPGLRKLPFRAVVVIVALIAVNIIVWAAVGVVLVRQ